MTTKDSKILASSYVHSLCVPRFNPKTAKIQKNPAHANKDIKK